MVFQDRLKDEIVKVNDKFRMLNTPMGKIMLGKADIADTIMALLLTLEYV